MAMPFMDGLSPAPGAGLRGKWKSDREHGSNSNGWRSALPPFRDHLLTPKPKNSFTLLKQTFSMIFPSSSSPEKYSPRSTRLPR